MNMNMNIKAFLEIHKEIEKLIKDNWKDLLTAFRIKGEHFFASFSLREEELLIFTDAFCPYEDEDFYVPLEWFESDEILKSNLAETIKKNEEEDLHKKEEDEIREIKYLEEQKAGIQKQLDEYYKKHPKDI